MRSRLSPILLCTSLAAACSGLPPAREPEPGAQPFRATPPAGADSFAAIERLEDARSDGDGLLLVLAQSEQVALRRRALEALGRLPMGRAPEPVTRALQRGLDDRDASVRATAAFALGFRADPAAAPALLAHRDEADALVRARIVGAASRIAVADLQWLVLAALEDTAPEVRAEAAEGAHRFPASLPPGAPEAAEVDRRLIAFVEAARARRGQVGAPDEGDGPWLALFSLARRKSSAARSLFLACAGSQSADEPWLRFFALKGLAELAPSAQEDSELAEACAASAADADWLLACEALRALGRLARIDSLPALELALHHERSHVRQAALRALSQYGASPAREAALALAQSVGGDASANVRATALEARALLGEVLGEGELRRLAADEDPVLRRGVARAAAALPDERALALLLPLTRDPKPFVATAAVEALGKHPLPPARERLRELLVGEDNGLRLAALEVSAGLAEPAGLLSDWQRTWDLSRGDIGAEARVALLRQARKSLPEAEITPLLVRAEVDPDPFVRQVAREIGGPGTRTTFEARAGVSLPPPSVPTGLLTDSTSPVHVTIETSRGPLEVELLPGEAPHHVRSFLELAGRDHYDGLSFHRVEPGFVVQGGCYRGDGNGGGSSRGPALRHEIGPRKYERGSLGMPRNDDLDSGGSQLFITHVPTPHLNGRYTIFGMLRSGFDVLDRLEVGDRILDVRIH